MTTTGWSWVVAALRRDLSFPVCNSLSGLLRTLILRMDNWRPREGSYLPGCLVCYAASRLQIQALNRSLFPCVCGRAGLAPRAQTSVLIDTPSVSTGTEPGSEGASTWSREERLLSLITVLRSQGPNEKLKAPNSTWTFKENNRVCLSLLIQTVY